MQLIIDKKFKKLLINGCLPITIDGCQKGQAHKIFLLFN